MVLIAERTEQKMIPNCLGMPLAKAKAILEYHGLSVSQVLYQDHGEYANKGSVLSQNPRAGLPVTKDGLVQLTVFQRSYLNYLPGIFRREDDRAGGTLRNYLRVFQHLMTGFQETIAHIPDIYHPHKTEESFLPYLASCLALDMEADWPAEQKRKCLAHAMELFKRRGTRQGLKLYLRIMTGQEVEIEEHILPVRPLILDQQTTLGSKVMLKSSADLKHVFTVRMPGFKEEYESSLLKRIHRIIHTEKPSHSEYFMVFKERTKVVQELIPWILGKMELGKGWISKRQKTNTKSEYRNTKQIEMQKANTKTKAGTTDAHG
jgi:phage tail-like protein